MADPRVVETVEMKAEYSGYNLVGQLGFGWVVRWVVLRVVMMALK